MRKKRLKTNTSNATCSSSHTIACACFDDTYTMKPNTDPNATWCQNCLSRGYNWVEGCIVSSWNPQNVCSCNTMPPSVPGLTCTYTCTNSTYTGSDCAACISSGGNCVTKCS